MFIFLDGMKDVPLAQRVGAESAVAMVTVTLEHSVLLQEALLTACFEVVGVGSCSRQFCSDTGVVWEVHVRGLD